MVTLVAPNEITAVSNDLLNKIGKGGGGVADAASLSAPLNTFTGTMVIQGSLAVVGAIGTTSKFVMTVPPQLPNFTVSDLNTNFPPSGATEGNICYVTDALNPVWRQTLVGGGGQICLAFSTDVAWIAV